MGRGVFVCSVRFGQDPHGFIGRFQAFSGRDKTATKLATELFSALRKGKQTQRRISEALVEMFAQSVSYKDAKQNIRYIEEIPNWESSFPTRLRLAVKRNPQVADSFGVPERVEALIKKKAK